MAKSYIGAYWGPRAESSEQSARWVVPLMMALARVDGSVSGWRDLGVTESAARANPAVEPDVSDVASRLQRTYRPKPSGVGFALTWWNGTEDVSAATTLAIICGNTSPRLTNSVVLRLPDSAASPSLYKPGTAGDLLRHVIAYTEADWATCTSDELRQKQAEAHVPASGKAANGRMSGVAAGWATYLRDDYPVEFDKSQLPTESRVDAYGAGRIVVLGDAVTAPPVAAVLAIRRSMGYDVM